jgi:hypothetical protein
MSCSIGALLAAISLLTQPPSNVVLTNITACTTNPSSAACHRERAVAAEAREATYYKLVTQAVLSCDDEEGFDGLFPNCIPRSMWTGSCRVMP